MYVRTVSSPDPEPDPEPEPEPDPLPEPVPIGVNGAVVVNSSPEGELVADAVADAAYELTMAELTAAACSTGQTVYILC